MRSGWMDWDQTWVVAARQRPAAITNLGVGSVTIDSLKYMDFELMI